MSYPTYYTPYNYGQYQPPQPRQDMIGANPPVMPNMAQSGSQAQMQGFLTRPVTSREEAVATQVDFMGPGTIMPDLSHGTIYLKRFNQNTGASDFFAFVLEKPQPEPEPVQYATKEDIDALREEIERLKKTGKGKKNEQPDE